MSPRNRRRTLAALVGGLVGIVGIGFAAMLLSATISGSTAFADRTGGFVVVDVTGTDSANVTCHDTTKTGDNSFKIDAVAKRVNGVVQTGSCVITLKLSNQGDTAVNLTGGGVDLPAGWTATGLGGPAQIPAGATTTYTATINATANATA